MCVDQDTNEDKAAENFHDKENGLNNDLETHSHAIFECETFKVPISEQPAQEDETDQQDGAFYRRMVTNRWTGPAMKRFPRVCACCIGVVIPLISLVVLSIFFGIILARFEAELEIESNDVLVRRKFFSSQATALVTQVSVAVPRVCVRGFVEGLEPGPFENKLLEYVLDNSTAFLENEVVRSNSANITELFLYLTACGEGSANYTTSLVDKAEEAVGESLDSVSFNWIQCYEGARDLKVSLSNDFYSSKHRVPDSQRAFYRNNWLEDFIRLRNLYQEEVVAKNESKLGEALVNAALRAMGEATGGKQCNLNGSGSAWFWFTVQTTIGYGNQAPVSEGGRALVFTAGFACILAFAAVLGTAGVVTAEVMESIFHKYPKYLGFLNDSRWGCLLWGALWYLWMLVIAYIYKRWKKDRLGEDFAPPDAYWFAYISTTTVGLGDFFLEPEVISGIDLLTFPLLFLVGFTFLSAFLGKFVELLATYLTHRKRSFVTSVLKHTKQDDQ